MRCKHCGHILNRFSAYCDYCGEPVSAGGKDNFGRVVEKKNEAVQRTVEREYVKYTEPSETQAEPKKVVKPVVTRTEEPRRAPKAPAKSEVFDITDDERARIEAAYAAIYANRVRQEAKSGQTSSPLDVHQMNSVMDKRLAEYHSDEPELSEFQEPQYKEYTEPEMVEEYEEAPVETGYAPEDEEFDGVFDEVNIPTPGEEGNEKADTEEVAYAEAEADVEADIADIPYEEYKEEEPEEPAPAPQAAAAPQPAEAPKKGYYDDDYDEKPKKKKSKAGIVILIIIIIIALLAGGVWALRTYFPNTTIGAKVVELTDKYIPWLADEEPATPSETSRAVPATDLTGIIQTQMDKDPEGKIKTIKYNAALKAEGSVFGTDIIKTSTEITNNVLYTDSAGEHYVDEAIVGAAIAYTANNADGTVNELALGEMRYEEKTGFYYIWMSLNGKEGMYRLKVKENVMKVDTAY